MTSASGLTLIKSTSKEKTYYVYYNEWDGSIVTIARHELSDIDSPFITSVDPVCGLILRGELDDHKYCITFDDNDSLTVAERSNTLRLRNSENKLFTLNRKFQPDWDIRVKVYTGNNKLMVEINSESIRKLSNLTFNKNIVASSNTDLSLYVTKYKNPDFLLDRIVIDPVELLTTGNVVYDISDLKKYVSFRDIGFLTRRIFKNYYYEVLPDSLNIIQQSLIKNKSFVHRNAIHDLNVAHVYIDEIDNQAVFSTELSRVELEDLGLYEDSLWLYVVGDTPDQLFGRIQLNLKELKTKKSTAIALSDSLYSCNILHKKHRVIFSLRKP